MVQASSLMDDEELTQGYMYFHTNENPATPLVYPILDSSNYHSWSRSMVIAPNAKNKVEFIDDTRP